MALKNSKALEMGKAEAKILFITSAYILVSSLLLITITHAVITSESEIQTMSDYFLCQSTGVQPGKQCDETSSGVQSTLLDTLSKVSIVLQSLIE